MSDENLHEETERLKKLLKELPEVDASADFEQRLRERLRAPRSIWRLVWEWIAPTGRVPAPVYSFATLLLLGLAAYYAFFRSGALPVSDQTPSTTPSPVTSSSTSGGTPDQYPSEKPAVKEAPGQPRDVKEKVSSEMAKADKRVSETPPTRDLDAGIKKEEVQIAGDDRRQSDDEAGRAGKVVVTQQPAEGVTATESKKAEPPATFRKDVQQAPQQAPQFMAAPTPSAAAPAGVQQVFGGRAKTVNAPRANSYEMNIDSVRIRDSLRVDSLRKAREDSLKKIRPE